MLAALAGFCWANDAVADSMPEQMQLFFLVTPFDEIGPLEGWPLVPRTSGSQSAAVAPHEHADSHAWWDTGVLGIEPRSLQRWQCSA